MPPESRKARILYLARILHEETDAECGLSLPEIQERLEEAGIAVERKALYRDLAALEEAGIAVGRLRTRPVRYYLATRLFDHAQLALLIDAVQTSRSITEANSHDLIDRLKRLHSHHVAQGFDSRIHVTGRVKMQNESVFTTLDSIQRALCEQRDVSFDYKRYDVRKELQEVKPQDGGPRVRTPLFLVYADDNYYLLAYDERSQDALRSYRVDRMHNVMILGPSDPHHRPVPGFDISAYERNTPGMYGGKAQRIHLHVAEGVMSNIIDLFGAEGVDSSPIEGVRELRAGGATVALERFDAAEEGRAAEGEGQRKWASVWVKAAPTPVLFGQICQFGGDVRIVGPASVANAYEDHLARVLEAQALGRERGAEA